jgi:hypothetical protein
VSTGDADRSTLPIVPDESGEHDPRLLRQLLGVIRGEAGTPGFPWRLSQHDSTSFLFNLVNRGGKHLRVVKSSWGGEVKDSHNATVADVDLLVELTDALLKIRAITEIYNGPKLYSVDGTLIAEITNDGLKFISGRKGDGQRSPIGLNGVYPMMIVAWDDLLSYIPPGWEVVYAGRFLLGSANEADRLAATEGGSDDLTHRHDIRHGHFGTQGFELRFTDDSFLTLDLEDTDDSEPIYLDENAVDNDNDANSDRQAARFDHRHQPVTGNLEIDLRLPPDEDWRTRGDRLQQVQQGDYVLSGLPALRTDNAYVEFGATNPLRPKYRKVYWIRRKATDS